MKKHPLLLLFLLLFSYLNSYANSFDDLLRDTGRPKGNVKENQTAAGRLTIRLVNQPLRSGNGPYLLANICV